MRELNTDGQAYREVQTLPERRDVATVKKTRGAQATMVRSVTPSRWDSSASDDSRFTMPSVSARSRPSSPSSTSTT